MGIKSIIIMDEKEYDVLEWSFTVSRHVDLNGRPTTNPKFRGMRVVMPSSKDTAFFKAAIHPDMRKQMELHVIRPFESKTEKMMLIDAHVVFDHTHFANDGSTPMTETVHINCGGFKDCESGAEISEHWRVTYPKEITETVENKKKIATKPQID